MARPSYPGVPYFPLDCQMDDDVKLIQAEYGLIGFAVIVKLFQKIYGGLGYYCEWDKDVGLLFAQEVGQGYSLVSEIVRSCLRRGIFSKEMFERHGILTSKGIQERYLRAVSRRVGEKILAEYALVSYTQKQGNETETEENADRNPENVDRKNVEKVKESKEHNTLSLSAHTRDEPKRYGKHQNILLSGAEYQDLCEKIANADAYIDYFSEKLYKKGYQYPNHHDSILDWWSKDKERFTQRAVKSSKNEHQKRIDQAEAPALGKSFDVDDFYQAALSRGLKSMESGG